MELKNRGGQNALEYILVFAIVVTIVIVAVIPKFGGFVSKKIDKSLDLSVEAVECMATSLCFDDPSKCTPRCGDGCCQSEIGETYENCKEDCSPGNEEGGTITTGGWRLPEGAKDPKAPTNHDYEPPDYNPTIP